LLSVPVQVIAWRAVSEMMHNVSSGTLNLTHSLTHSLIAFVKTCLCSVRCCPCE